MATWDIESGVITLQTAQEPTPRQFDFGAIGSVIEPMYAEEITAFIDAVLGRKTWPQGYSQHSSATLAAAEKSSVTGQWIKVDPSIEPDPAPPLRT
ncbi:MAG: hypothetical protein H0T60_09190 [Acidobacteria bacterium]|nr:hypothetical protein [Acidobacteriota bacterium]